MRARKGTRNLKPFFQKALSVIDKVAWLVQEYIIERNSFPASLFIVRLCFFVAKMTPRVIWVFERNKWEGGALSLVVPLHCLSPKWVRYFVVTEIRMRHDEFLNVVLFYCSLPLQPQS